MASTAQQRLKELCAGILHNESAPKTLAYFRLSNSAIVRDLNDFAASLNDDNGQNTPTKPLLDQVLVLFRNLNLHMAEQEQTCPTWGDFFVASNQRQREISDSTSLPIEISVVFGGKYSKHPTSISEQLVSKLIRRSQTVYTVSRSTCRQDELPNTVKHIPKQNLDTCNGPLNNNTIDADTRGVDEFYDVMSMAKEEWLKTSLSLLDSKSTTVMLVFYFTLGQLKGVNPFVRNLNSAQNFHRALRQLCLSSSEIDNEDRRNWRVVLTGTDATLPSTHPPSEMIFTSKKNGNEDAPMTTVLTVPTYKIGAYNFVYAMSKLGQYCWIMNAVVSLLMSRKHTQEQGKRYEEIINETKDMFQKIKTHVDEAGEDGVYHGDTSSTIISMEELDAISVKMTALVEEGLLRDHFRIAKQISICYTPLHAKPWTVDAVRSASNDVSAQKVFIIEQIVRRFKNAISIESAASSHFL